MSEFQAYADMDLIGLMKAQNSQAFEEIYRRYWRVLYSITYRRIQSREISEEIVQDIFASLWINRSTASIQCLSSYLSSAAKYKAINHLAREMSRQAYAHDQQLRSERKHDNCTEESVLLNDFTGALEREIEKLVLDTRAREATCFTRSFDPIVGFNANGAFVHGQVPDDQVKTVEGNGLLLIDSGGQYLDGTTDVTRTLAIGNPTAEMKRCFTLVMKGHIALASAVFPEGTPGVALDVLARQYLWSAGLDYAHGTGHGVGYCLNVHEGPCNFSPKPLRASEPLKAGILMSNEPGYYKEGAFGIRLENLCLVVPADKPGFLKLDTVTLAPFDTRALDLSMMSADEKAWLNDYHARVRKILFPLVEPEIAAWLTDATAPV